MFFRKNSPVKTYYNHDSFFKSYPVNPIPFLETSITDTLYLAKRKYKYYKIEKDKEKTCCGGSGC